MSKPLAYYVEFYNSGGLQVLKGFDTIEEARKYLSEQAEYAEPGDTFNVTETD